MNNGQRRHLLGDEQHRLTLPKGVRDDVGDGLALAGARWPLKHKVAAGLDGADRLELRRIGEKRRQDVLGLELAVQIPKLVSLTVAWNG